MRKSMRVLILILMLFTSLTAGTLAVYTSHVDLAPVTISAKRFVLGVNQGGQDEFDLKIGPGELISYQFVVTNEDSSGDTSEVDMDLQINADFSAETLAHDVICHPGSGSVGIHFLQRGKGVGEDNYAGILHGNGITAGGTDTDQIGVIEIVGHRMPCIHQHQTAFT